MPKDNKRKVEYKKVILDGKPCIATRLEGDTHWIVAHDHQDQIKKDSEAQDASV